MVSTVDLLVNFSVKLETNLKNTLNSANHVCKLSGLEIAGCLGRTNSMRSSQYGQ